MAERINVRNISDAVRVLARIVKEQVTDKPTITLDTDAGTLTSSRGFRGVEVADLSDLPNVDVAER